jgi:hypothetical protein
MYTLKLGNKTMSVLHKEKHYIIGFNNVKLARKVHYSIHPHPNFLLVRGTDIDLSKDLNEFNISLNLDTSANLYIRKMNGSVWDPMNDSGFHLHAYKEEEFLLFPIQKQLGIIVPYRIEEESENEFMLRAYIIDPAEI